MRKLWIAIAVAAVVVIGAGAFIYFVVFPNDSPPPLTLSTTGTTVAAGSPATTGAGASSDPSVTSPDGSADASSSDAGVAITADNLAGTWKVTDGSIAGYRVREKLAQLPAKSDAVGRTSDVTGTVTIDGSGSAFTATAADVSVDVTTLVSNSDRRDGQIKRRGLQTDTFPTATFKLTQPATIPAEALNGSPVTVQARGDMTIHGVTKSVTIPLQTQINGDKVEIVGSLTFPMSDFGIEPPTIAGIVDVESNATLEFQVFLAK